METCMCCLQCTVCEHGVDIAVYVQLQLALWFFLCVGPGRLTGLPARVMSAIIGRT